MNAIVRHWDVVRSALADEKERAKGLVKTDEVSFLPAAMEIVERPVSPTARATARVLADLTKAEADATLRREELTKAHQRSSLQRLVSPVDGTVAQLAVHTLGGVVEATKPVMVVVPNSGALVAEVKVLNKDAGFVHVGQPVALKLEAFPFTRYGTIPGHIQNIGSDSVADEKLGLVYTARVKQDRATIDPDGQSANLVPGMVARAGIRTGLRSILSYLMGPIDKARMEAGRER